MNTFRSELRKLLTIRSTYIMALIIASVVVVVSVASLLQQDITGGQILPSSLEMSLFGGISVSAQLAGVFAVLLIGHEYRYHTIYQTLTMVRSRSMVLIAKMIVVVLYALIVTAVATGLGYIGSLVAFNFIEESAADQVLDVGKLLLHGFIYVTGFALIGLLLGLLFRTIVAPIVILILAPGTIEPLLGLALNDGEKYLPFTSIQALVIPEMEANLLQSVLTISTYLVVGWAFVWYRFHKKDAA